MDFLRMDAERLVLHTVCRLVQDCIASRAQATDEHGQFPHENFADFHRAGLLKMVVRTEYGGFGCGLLDNFLFTLEEIAT